MNADKPLNDRYTDATQRLIRQMKPDVGLRDTWNVQADDVLRQHSTNS